MLSMFSFLRMMSSFLSMISSLRWIVFLSLFLQVCSDGPRVRTKFGLIEGRRIFVRGVAVDEFVGVPFAKPPVGNLRFARPQELTPWNGVYNATSVSAQCPQPNQYVKHSEDCLYLNIWRPAMDPTGLDAQAPTNQVPSSSQFPTSNQAPSSGQAPSGQAPRWTETEG